MKKITDFIKKSKYQAFFGIAFIVFGAIILLMPGSTLKTVCFLIGVVVAAKGVFSLISYIRARNTGNEHFGDLLSGILTLAGAFILICHPQKLLSIVPVIIGIAVLVYGISALFSKHGGLVSKIISVITILIGAGIVGSPFKLAQAITSVMGFAMIIIGILIIANEITLAKPPEKIDESGYKEVDFTDVDE